MFKILNDLSASKKEVRGHPKIAMTTERMKTNTKAIKVPNQIRERRICTDLGRIFRQKVNGLVIRVAVKPASNAIKIGAKPPPTR